MRGLHRRRPHSNAESADLARAMVQYVLRIENVAGRIDEATWRARSLDVAFAADRAGIIDLLPRENVLGVSPRQILDASDHRALAERFLLILTFGGIFGVLGLAVSSPVLEHASVLRESLAAAFVALPLVLTDPITRLFDRHRRRLCLGVGARAAKLAAASLERERERQVAATLREAVAPTVAAEIAALDCSLTPSADAVLEEVAGSLERLPRRERRRAGRLAETPSGRVAQLRRVVERSLGAEYAAGSLTSRAYEEALIRCRHEMDPEALADYFDDSRCLELGIYGKSTACRALGFGESLLTPTERVSVALVGGAGVWLVLAMGVSAGLIAAGVTAGVLFGVGALGALGRRVSLRHRRIALLGLTAGGRRLVRRSVKIVRQRLATAAATGERERQLALERAHAAAVLAATEL